MALPGRYRYFEYPFLEHVEETFNWVELRRVGGVVYDMDLEQFASLDH